MVGLFVFDINSPRGQVDGIGYAALVAVCMRFGRRVLIAIACVTTALTVLGTFLVPDAGISVEGEMANRAFAIISIWIVTFLLVRRLRLENEIERREATIARHQDAILRIARETLASDVPLVSKIRAITEIAADAVEVERVSVWVRRPDEDTLRCIDRWERSTRTHALAAALPRNTSPGYDDYIREHLIVVANDVFEHPILRERRETMILAGIRAIIGAGIFVDGSTLGILSLGHVGGPREWTPEETTFARSVASILALAFLESRHREALTALDLVGEGICVENVEGRVVYANAAARETAGLQDGALARASAFPHPDAPLVAAHDMHEVSRGNEEFEIHRTRLPAGGIVTRIDNVTARNVAVRERTELATKLQRAAKMQALGQLAGGIAHDFNNLLGAILGFAGLLRDDLPANSKERGFADRILAAGSKGKELVEQILAFARTGGVEHKPVDLSRVFHEAESLLSAASHYAGRLSFECAPRRFSVLAREVQIIQLIANLCRNASDALGTVPGRITASLAPAPQTDLQRLSTWRSAPDELLVGVIDMSKAYARIRVADTGAGMAPDVLARIFEPFFTTKGRQRGTGLGLAVVHGVVESHGGACLVESAPGRGTVFSIYLPLADRPAPADAAPADQATITGNERVLIVDDEPDIADMLCIGLERLGYKPIAVLDPREAVAAFEEDPTAWDVVVTDQVMPAMRGLDLVRKLKAIRPDVRTVLCTGFSDSTNEEAARAAGVDAFVRKPVDAQALAPHLRRTFENQTPL